MARDKNLDASADMMRALMREGKGGTEDEEVAFTIHAKLTTSKLVHIYLMFTLTLLDLGIS